MKYPLYLQRMIEEHRQLSSRTDKLHNFYKKGKPRDTSDVEWLLLFRQRNVMETYKEVLAERIKLITRKLNHDR